MGKWGRWLIALWALPFFGQGTVERFLTPADSLDSGRRNTVVITEAVGAAATLAALNQVWYADYPRSDFHFIDDNAEWLQMDKAGHVFSAYHLGRIGSDVLQWSGASRKSQLLYGATLGFVFLSAVEVMDGYSAKWGASWGDVVANAAGTALYVSQELMWKEQRIVPKFSFHTTVYAGARPDALGSTLPEQVLKDYNGQTYWLSLNLKSFTKIEALPAWLNVAVGYGATGMITGEDRLVNTVFFPDKQRMRQFYLSLDVDLTRIPTRSHTLKTLFSLFNTLKVPAPALEIKGSQGAYWHWVYF
ncbi:MULTISPECIES: DUF2279 domain-containing protein [unclassified Flavobacterium]|uniref:DUF2279 domain-containing protein n=1 Tax=unclassified Flavobacterium TaxID=196869 RepID=UPI001F131EBC|nr:MULTISPECIES: DUF2279 domain-containing protein [unclassified Flavobacterium]UMY65799.1 YfiM family protein [Flavobacterium sp. HJ-32-4]